MVRIQYFSEARFQLDLALQERKLATNEWKATNLQQAAYECMKIFEEPHNFESNYLYPDDLMQGTEAG